MVNWQASIIVSANVQTETATAGFSRVWLVAGGFIPRRGRPGINPRPTSSTALKGAEVAETMIKANWHHIALTAFY
jgi:hypothetical protein